MANYPWQNRVQNDSEAPPQTSRPRAATPAPDFRLLDDNLDEEDDNDLDKDYENSDEDGDGSDEGLFLNDNKNDTDHDNQGDSDDDSDLDISLKLNISSESDSDDPDDPDARPGPLCNADNRWCDKLMLAVEGLIKNRAKNSGVRSELIMERCGIGGKATRKESSWNIWQKKWRVDNPLAEGEKGMAAVIHTV